MDHSYPFARADLAVPQFCKKRPSQRQLLALRIVAESIVNRGHPPTLREIGELMGIRSTNGVNDHLMGLERRGLLSHDEMRSRARMPTELGWAVLGMTRPNYETPAMKARRLERAAQYPVLPAEAFKLAYRCSISWCHALVFVGTTKCPACENLNTLVPDFEAISSFNPDSSGDFLRASGQS